MKYFIQTTIWMRFLCCKVYAKHISRITCQSISISSLSTSPSISCISSFFLNSLAISNFTCMLPIYNLTKGHYVWYIREGEKFSKHTKSFYSINLLHRTKENNNGTGIYPLTLEVYLDKTETHSIHFTFDILNTKKEKENVEYLLYCEWYRRKDNYWLFWESKI